MLLEHIVDTLETANVEWQEICCKLDDSRLVSEDLACSQAAAMWELGYLCQSFWCRFTKCHEAGMEDIGGGQNSKQKMAECSHNEGLSGGQGGQPEATKGVRAGQQPAREVLSEARVVGKGKE